MIKDMQFGGDDAAWRACLEALIEAGWPVDLAPGHAQITDPATGAACLTLWHRTEAALGDPFDILRALDAGRIEDALVGSIPAGLAVERVMVTFNWTVVRAGDLCGIARSPARGTEGARSIRPDAGFAGYELRDLAQLLCSLDPLARSVGLAAVNAYWNRAETPGQSANGGFQAIAPPGDGVVIIGGFRGVQRRLPDARIVEREPKPGDIPAAEAAPALRAARLLAITGQTLMNASLDPLLRSAGAGPRKLLVGPSVPLCPLLFDHGLDALSAAIVTDPDAAERFACETGTMIMRDEIARSAYLNKENHP